MTVRYPIPDVQHNLCSLLSWLLSEKGFRVGSTTWREGATMVRSRPSHLFMKCRNQPFPDRSTSLHPIFLSCSDSIFWAFQSSLMLEHLFNCLSVISALKRMIRLNCSKYLQCMLNLIWLCSWILLTWSYRCQLALMLSTEYDLWICD